MSTSLVRESLDILGFDNDVKQGKKKKKAKKSKGILSLIPANYRINKPGEKDAKVDIKEHSSKVNIDEVKAKLQTKTDPTDENIEKLLLLSSSRMDPFVSKKILSRAVHKRYVPEVKKAKKPEKSVFSEEDFKQFEKEYFGE